MSRANPKQADEPRVEIHGPIAVAGFARTYACDGANDIPAQWQKLAPHMAALAGTNCGAYGVCSGPIGNNESYQYLAGVAVGDVAKLPEGFATVTIPARRYAVFTHSGSVMNISDTAQRAFREDLPRAGLVPEGEPGLIEVYDGRFDARTGSGEVDLWIPVKG